MENRGMIHRMLTVGHCRAKGKGENSNGDWPAHLLEGLSISLHCWGICSQHCRPGFA